MRTRHDFEKISWLVDNDWLIEVEFVPFIIHATSRRQ